MSAPRRRLAPVPALLLAGAALLALGFCVQVLERTPPGDVPGLVLLAPADRDTVRDSLVVRFRTPVPLTLGPRGWTAGALHPHAWIDQREHMAAAADIRVDGDEYHWRLPLPPAGWHTLRLGWAGADHQARGTAAGATAFFVP